VLHRACGPISYYGQIAFIGFMFAWRRRLTASILCSVSAGLLVRMATRARAARLRAAGFTSATRFVGRLATGTIAAQSHNDSWEASTGRLHVASITRRPTSLARDQNGRAVRSQRSTAPVIVRVHRSASLP